MFPMCDTLAGFLKGFFLAASVEGLRMSMKFALIQGFGRDFDMSNVSTPRFLSAISFNRSFKSTPPISLRWGKVYYYYALLNT